jgi:hypothetical protein
MVGLVEAMKRLQNTYSDGRISGGHEEIILIW